MEVIIVDNNACNDKTFRVLDLSSFVELKLFKVGDDCFENVKEVKLIGLKLVRVVIGKYCFRKSGDEDKSGHFYLKDCEKLKELKIGCKSFYDYSVCEIVNVPSLEVIEMDGFNFWHAPLELKSVGAGMK